MGAFLATTLGKVALAGVGLLALGGIAWAIIHNLEGAGADQQRAADAVQTTKESDDARKEREAAERRARDDSYCVELGGLPGDAPACP